MNSGSVGTSHQHHNSHVFRRCLALFMSIFVGLASGTPYLYGIYSPQLVKRVQLTASDSATISLAINIGTGVGGFLGGILIDHKGPQFCIFLGSIFIFLGYMGLYQVYRHAYSSLFVICFCAMVMGFGSIASYFATLKASQTNFPAHRGSAGVFPVSSYGLAASLFSLVTAKFFESDTGGLLRFLSLCCGTTVFIGSWFVKIFVDDHPVDEEAETQPLLSSSSEANTEDAETAADMKLSYSDNASIAGSISFWGIGDRTPRSSSSSLSPDLVPTVNGLREENASATPKRPAFSNRNNSFASAWIIVWDLLTNRQFLAHFSLVALFTGSAQTYIFSIGFIVAAQVTYSEYSDLNAPQVQALQVAILSIASFSGRLTSGILSDFLYKKLHIQRLWIIIVNTAILAVGLFITSVNNGNIHLISLTSALIGGSFGLTFGTYPAIIADFFGTRTFSTTWGLICMGPLLVLYILNKFFGIIYDANTDPDTGICYKGNGCYKGAIEACFSLCFIIVVINILLIYIHRKRQ
ncbi:monocarboxylate transporter [Yamadazyma tenuis ATCC 10573]|uniref:Monocarboxylate transporter n=1 Tax=Candida tenuis (strain ATCC 10573 / BCRC 21748 / CBS 615 / JCM 9827 / NBRC 10315 / NRRL Y-1498 / VKM Y-70) TaxID=590646 RepID=G3AZT1_CANTC|nr:monocarboxylate transporter [Yamadazyma tenuis ATCC 10573]EGV65233.1 monocarboxylate transporter [Yamadazyma tenuis ATCC 10573]